MELSLSKQPCEDDAEDEDDNDKNEDDVDDEDDLCDELVEIMMPIRFLQLSILDLYSVQGENVLDLN